MSSKYNSGYLKDFRRSSHFNYPRKVLHIKCSLYCTRRQGDIYEQQIQIRFIHRSNISYCDIARFAMQVPHMHSPPQACNNAIDFRGCHGNPEAESQPLNECNIGEAICAASIDISSRPMTHTAHTAVSLCAGG